MNSSVLWHMRLVSSKLCFRLSIVGDEICAVGNHNGILFTYWPDLKTHLFGWKEPAVEFNNARLDVWLEAHSHCVSTKPGGKTKVVWIILTYSSV